MSAECVRDGSPVGDGAVLCSTCTEDTRRALDELARLLPMLRTTAAGQAVSATRTARVKGTGHSEGINLHALDVLAEVRMVVTGWLRVMLEDEVSTDLPNRSDDGFTDTARLCSHLASRMVLVRHHEAAGEVAAEVLDPGSFIWKGESIGRPDLVALVEQSVDTHREDPTIHDVVSPEDLNRAMQSFVTVKVAYEAARRYNPNFRRHLRTVQGWLGPHSDAVYISRTDMEGNKLVMPDTILELAAKPPTVTKPRPGEAEPESAEAA